ncbi:pyridoxal phosphate-dependent transferase [Chloropicon primus]|nr:pyridoxal phosphate-dependent transferase [Chloropicon primus]
MLMRGKGFVQAAAWAERARRVLGGGAGGHVEEWKALLEAAEHPSVVNLTQGYPDFEGSRKARLEAAEVITRLEHNKLNQYSPLVGLGTLMASITSLYSRLWNMKDLDAKKNVVVTSSGTEAISVAFQTLVSPGDEVILFEPYFPWYGPGVKLAGGEAKLVRLSMEDDFKIDKAKLLEKFNPEKTRLIVVNTPHNPSGRVLTREELEIVHEVASTSRVGCTLFSDEAYEGQCWAPGGHKKVQQEIEQLNEATGSSVEVLSMGTSSKLCSLTGWRVGWLVGPEHIINGCKALHGYSTYCAPTPFQHGIAKALDGFVDLDPAVSFDGTGALMKMNAEKLSAVLRDMGLRVYSPKGGYFVVADCSPLGFTSNMEFCKDLLEKCKVAAAPMNMFFGTPASELSSAEQCLVRFAICKTEPVVDEAISRMRKLIASSSK